ncbi:MAG TPA: hypothetical protein VGL26_08085 [Jatrophihabitans sp.]|jgi:hypothetical protein
MKQINRRELNQRSGQILDEVIATGEPVEVISRDGESVIISKKPESTYERLVREGFLIPAKRVGSWADVKPVESKRSVEEIMAEMEEDR